PARPRRRGHRGDHRPAVRDRRGAHGLRRHPDRGHARRRSAAPHLLTEETPAAGRPPSEGDSDMCPGIPGRVGEIGDPEELLADQDLRADDWVLVHVGFAMAKIDEEEAKLTIEAMKKLGQAYTDEIEAFNSTAII